MGQSASEQQLRHTWLGQLCSSLAYVLLAALTALMRAAHLIVQTIGLRLHSNGKEMETTHTTVGSIVKPVGELKQSIGSSEDAHK